MQHQYNYLHDYYQRISITGEASLINRNSLLLLLNKHTNEHFRKYYSDRGRFNHLAWIREETARLTITFKFWHTATHSLTHTHTHTNSHIQRTCIQLLAQANELLRK